MKTIEEAAIEYAVKESNIDNSKPVEIKQQLYAHELMYAFQAGVEFAQRLIPVDEELPVFDKAKYPNGDYEQYFVKISTGGMNPVIKYGVAHLINKSKWSCESDWNVVTHYRPIKYK